MRNNILFASFALLCMIGLLSTASAAQITKIGTGHDPAIYGNMVTWSGDNASIQVYDLTAQKVTTINSSSSSYPAIYGNKIVWHDESSGTPMLTVYDIPSGAISNITQNVDSTSFPAIYENRIVWNSGGNVYMYDISTSIQTQIAVGNNPDIYDTKVVYSADGRENKDIFMYDITTKKTELISPDSSDINRPRMYGNKVIWTNDRTRMGFIQMYDIFTKKAIDVTSDNAYNGDPNNPDAGDDTGTHIDINDDKIVYAKTSEDIFGNVGIYVYNISTGQSTVVINYAEGVYTTPSIYNSTIVWGFENPYTTDAASNDIYVCNLEATGTTVTQPPVASFTSDATSVGVPLSVAFTDTSTGKPTLWYWDFGDGANSTEQNPIHTYSAAGNYTVHLTVSNTNGTDSKSSTIIATITVLEQTIPVLPAADFSSNLNSGIAPFEVKFTDASQNATGWKWDFGDGYTSTEQNSTHTYFSAGAYLVSLKVSNVNGTTSKTATINVREKSGSSGGSSSGSAGGAGGSPEPQSNVQAKEYSQTFISSGKSVKFDFPRNATLVVSISFDSKKTAGKITTIAEMLKEKSTLVTGLPSDEVYKYLNIWVGNSGFATPNNIENPVVCFKVDKSWIHDKKIDTSSITLNRYSNKKWNQLPASLSSEDDKYLYFTAKTPGFSPFAITGKSTATGTAIQPAGGDKKQLAVDDKQNKSTGSMATNVEQTPEQKQNSNTTGKESTKTPEFEIASGIFCLFSIFLYKRI